MIAEDSKLTLQNEIKATDDAAINNLTNSFGNVAVSHDRSVGGSHTGVAGCRGDCYTQRGCCGSRRQGRRECQGSISWAVVTLFTAAKTAHQKHQVEKNKRAEAVKAELNSYLATSHEIERGEKTERSTMLDSEHECQGCTTKNQMAALVQVEERVRRERMSCCQAMKARWVVLQKDERYAQVEEQVRLGNMTRCQAKKARRAIWRAQKKEIREVRRQLGYGCC